MKLKLMKKMILSILLMKIKNLKVAGVNNLSFKPVNDEYFIGVLKESLWKNSGSRAADINGNGIKE